MAEFLETELSYQEQKTFLEEIQDGQRLFLDEAGMIEQGIGLISYPYEGEGIVIATLCLSRITTQGELIRLVNMRLDHKRMRSGEMATTTTPVQIAKVIEDRIQPAPLFNAEDAKYAVHLLQGVNILQNQGYLSLIDETLHHIVQPNVRERDSLTF